MILKVILTNMIGFVTWSTFKIGSVGKTWPSYVQSHLICENKLKLCCKVINVLNVILNGSYKLVLSYIKFLKYIVNLSVC